MDELLARWSEYLRRPRALGALVAVLAALAVFLPLLGYIQYNQASDDVGDSERVLENVEEVLFAAVNAEAAVRGYVLSGDPAFREPFDASVASFEQHIARARDHARGDTASLEQLDAMETDFQRWLEEAARPQMARVESGELDAAQELATSGEGRDVFADLRQAAQEATGYLEAKLDDQQGAQDRAWMLGIMFGLAGGVSIFAVGGLVAAAVIERSREGTERARAEESLETERAVSARRGEMLSAASHDLRNPLGAIVMAADVLAEEAEAGGDASLSELAADVKRGAHRTAMLVSDLLDFTRVEAGRLVIERRHLDPVELIDEAIADLRLWRPGQHVEIDADVPAGQAIVGDSRRLRAAIRNLLDNACQYAEPPYRVRVLDAGGALEIHIEDAGPGVPEADCERIFQRFERGSTAREQEGTGIGLFVCRGIAELHGGHLHVGRSMLGGADFVLRVPSVTGAVAPAS